MVKCYHIFVILIAVFFSTDVCEAAPKEKTAAYIGSAECKQCHSDEYKGWRSTLHPYKFQPVSADAVIGDFENNNTITDKGQEISMSKEGDDFFVTAPGPDGKSHPYQVKYLIGAFWKQHYVTEFENGELHILPPTWIAETRSWETTDYWPDTIYQNSCAGCHNTGVRINHDPVTDTYQTTWTETGVGCESCHGPGGRHVAAEASDKSETIINPARIPDPRRAAMVCGSCHTRGTSPDGKYGYPSGYQPGDLLDFKFNEKPKLKRGKAETNRA